MIKISLTDFVDFVAKSGTPKFTHVKQIKNRESYHPSMDFWRALREAIIHLHKEGLEKRALDVLVKDLSDEKKIKAYPELIRQYQSFIGKKNLEWFEPPYKEWMSNELIVRLNPELGLVIKDTNHVVKLYFKAEPLDKRKADVILLLLNTQLKNGPFENVEFSILDIRSNRLFTSAKLNLEYLPLLEGEAVNFSTIWRGLN